MTNNSQLSTFNSQLPKGWEIKKLGEVCTIKPPKKLAKEQLSDEELVTFFPMADLKEFNHYINPVQTKRLKDVYKGYVYFENNDVLLAKITPCFENGKLGIVKNLENGIGFGSSEYMVFRPDDNISSEYIYYFLSLEFIRREGKTKMTGAVGHKRIPVEYISNQNLLIPPLPEQQRIVDILDKAFVAIDKAKQNAEQNLSNAKEVFDNYLQTTFDNGKLKIDSGEWEEKKLNEIAENLDSKRIPITKRNRKPGNIPYYGASGIVDYVSDYIFDEDLLCISEDGANLLARTYPIAFSISGKTWVNNHAHILKFSNLINQQFVEIYMNSIKLDEYIGGMAQPKLYQTQLNKIPIPFPPIETQKQIVQKLDALQAQTKKLEAIYQQKINNMVEIKKSILQKAFEGEL